MMLDSKTEKMRSLFADKQLTAEELEEVVGGSNHDWADDSRFLNVLLRGRPGQCDRYGESDYVIPYHIDEVRAAWATVGVQARMPKKIDGTGNSIVSEPEYFIDGKRVRRVEAWEHAMKVVGKRLKRSDWYWD